MKVYRTNAFLEVFDMLRVITQLGILNATVKIT